MSGTSLQELMELGGWKSFEKVLAGSWLSNDANHFFSVTGTLGGKQVAVLVPEA